MRLRAVTGALEGAGKILDPHRRLVTLATTSAGAAAGIAVVAPLLVKRLIDEAIPSRDAASINLTAAGLLFAAIVAAAAALFYETASARAAERAAHDERERAHAALRARPTRSYEGGPEELTARVAAAGAVAGSLAAACISSIAAALTAASLLVAMTIVSPLLTLVTAAAAAPAALGIAALSRLHHRLASRRDEIRDRLAARVRETFAAAGDMAAGGSDEHERRRVSQASRAVLRASVRGAVASRSVRIAQRTAWVVVPALAWLAGGHRASAGAITLGGLVAFTAYQALLYEPLRRLAVAAPRLLASTGDPLREGMPAVEVPLQRPAARTIARAQGSIAFEGVTFAYPGAPPAIRGVGFGVPPGRMLALVGPPGAGKSTIARCAARLEDPVEGAVLLDGIDLRELTLESVAAAVAILGDEPALFAGTVRENLLYARPGATEGQVAEAAKAAQVHDAVLALDAGYDTPVGAGGVELDRSMRARLTIARLLLRDPAVIVLDEASAQPAPDAATQRATAALLRGRTSIVTARRAHTLHEADQILVLDAGRVVETGTHADLVRAGGRYARLYRERFALGPRLADVIA